MFQFFFSKLKSNIQDFFILIFFQFFSKGPFHLILINKKKLGKYDFHI